MTGPGSDCPECGGRLNAAGACPACRWAPNPFAGAAPALTRECSACHRQRPSERVGDKASLPCPNCGAVSAWWCEGCGSRAPGTIVDDGVQRCSACRVAAKRPGRVLDPDYDLRALQRLKVLTQHLAAMPDSQAVDTRSPSLLERQGVHAMREVAVAWCRAHPALAAALPGWHPGVLRRATAPAPEPPEPAP